MSRLIFLILDEIHLLDLAGPSQVFYTAIERGADYELCFSSSQTTIKSAQKLVISELSPLPILKKEDSLIVVGVRTHNNGKLSFPKSYQNPEIISYLQKAASLGNRITSVCSGSLLLAEAGLLKNKRCTTHWQLIELLKERAPKAKVQDAVLFSHDDNIITSAGIASGIDMAMYMLEQDQGANFAAKVARDLVIYYRRNGDSSQTSIYFEYRSHLNHQLHRAQDYIIKNPNQTIKLDDLAKIAHTSVSNLTRSFKKEVGMTPLQYQHRIRLEPARNLLLSSDLSVEAISDKCGFNDSRSFRRVWASTFGISPSTFRKS